MSKRESATKTDENDILWHSGHYAAIKLEFLENDADLTYETEHQLNHEPIRIDLLVIFVGIILWNISPKKIA